MLNRRQFQILSQEVKAPEGGFTIDINTGRRPDSGTSVSLPGHEKAMPAAQATPGAIKGYTKANAKVLTQPGNHLGGWNESPASGPEAFLDVSTVIPDEVDARRAIMDRNQIAGFNLDSVESVYNPFHPRTGEADAQFGGIGPDNSENREFWATSPNRRPANRGRNGMLGPGKDFT